ncbi:hypothetical protein ACF09G_33455 [Streptomyces albogriseolus]|uniref:hypothetical protein n=1 Tax=Streptomyces albogriseolus TaxID=1887 RepID=UPI0036F5528E
MVQDDVAPGLDALMNRVGIGVDDGPFALEVGVLGVVHAVAAVEAEVRAERDALNVELAEAEDGRVAARKAGRRMTRYINLGQQEPKVSNLSKILEPL